MQVKSSLIAQAAEIQQLRNEVLNHQERIKVLEEQAGAEEVNQTYPKLDVYVTDRKEYGCAHVSSESNLKRRRNVVIHGLKAVEISDIKQLVVSSLPRILLT